MQKRNDRTGGKVSVRLPLTDFCLYIPLLGVASSVQQISVLPEYVAFRVLLLIAAFLKSLNHLYSVSIQFFLWYFCSCFLVLLVSLCSRTRYAGKSLA